jgi:hypothetical protein
MKMCWNILLVELRCSHSCRERTELNTFPNRGANSQRIRKILRGREIKKVKVDKEKKMGQRPRLERNKQRRP